MKKKRWKTFEAIGTYCEVCKVTIPYSSAKNSGGVHRHMRNFHQDLLDKYVDDEGKKREREKIMAEEVCSLAKKSRYEAERKERMKFTKLISIWTACALRPPSIVEDIELQNAFNFASRDGIPLKLPSRTTNEQQINELTEIGRAHV